MSRLLSRGSVGEDVKDVQGRLNGRPPSSLPPLDVDGQFGDRTQARVIEFQKLNGLAADGIVGPATRARLFAGPVAVPSSTPVGAPAVLASSVTPQAQIWGNNALMAIAEHEALVQRGQGTTSDRRFPATLEAFRMHFHLLNPVSGAAGLLMVIKRNYADVQNVLLSVGAHIQSVDKATARQETRRADVVPAYTFPGGRQKGQRMRFTPAFKARGAVVTDPTTGLPDPETGPGFGPLCRAAMVLHECVHYVDVLANNANDVVEHPFGNPAYANLTPDRACHNPSSYVCFGQHVTEGSDVRFGAGRPAD